MPGHLLFPEVCLYHKVIVKGIMLEIVQNKNSTGFDWPKMIIQEFFFFFFLEMALAGFLKHQKAAKQNGMFSSN